MDRDETKTKPPKTAAQNLMHFLAGVAMLAAFGGVVWFWWSHVATTLGQVGCGFVAFCLLFATIQAFEESGRP